MSEIELLKVRTKELEGLLLKALRVVRLSGYTNLAGQIATALDRGSVDEVDTRRTSRNVSADGGETAA